MFYFLLVLLTKPVAVHCCSFQSMITCCYHCMSFQIPIRIFLSILSFHDPSLKLLRPTQCINSNRHIFLLTLSPLISHCNAHSFFLEYYISHTDICHTQSFVFLMSQSTKQHRHPIRSLSTLFLPAVCHH